MTGEGLVVGQLVDADHNSEYQRVVLAGSKSRPCRCPERGPTLGDLSDVVTVALDLHRVPDVQGLLLDLEELFAGRVPQDQRAPEAERIAVDLERSFARLALDPEVLADREYLLARLGTPSDRHHDRVWVMASRPSRMLLARLRRITPCG